MARRRGNPLNDFIDTAGAWLGGTRNIQSPAVTRGRETIQGTLGALDQAAGGFGRAAVNDAQRLSSGGGYVPSQTIKTAAVNAAAAAAGYTAAKGVQRAVQSGVPQRAVRAVTGRNTGYFVHGSPTTGIKKLDPKYELDPETVVSEPFFDERWPDGPDPSTAALYGNPITRTAGEKGSANTLMHGQKYVRGQIKGSLGYANTGLDEYSGSLYIAKAPRSKIGFDSDEIISSPAKVVKEIKTAYKTDAQVVRETEDALKRMGFRYQKPAKPAKPSRGGSSKKR